MKNKLLTVSATALCALALACVNAQAQAPQYTVTVLGGLGGADAGGDNFLGVNASGQVTGASYTAGGNPHATLWNGSTPTDLGAPGGATSFAAGINASGQVAGYSGADAVRWTGTTAAILDNIETSGESWAYGINTTGQVTGLSFGGGGYSAIVWTGTTPTVLGSVGTGNIGYSINDFGQVAGVTITPGETEYSAVRWDGTVPTVLNTLGGTNGTFATGINASGQIAGYSFIAGNASTHAVLWNGNTPTDLGTLGGNDSEGYAINDSGEVVGTSYTVSGSDDGPDDPFLYTNGTMYDLKSLLVPGSGVISLGLDQLGNSINDSGQIVAYGAVDGYSGQHALLLTPVTAPEPSTAFLGVMGVLPLLFRRLRGGQRESLRAANRCSIRNPNS